MILFSLLPIGTTSTRYLCRSNASYSPLQARWQWAREDSGELRLRPYDGWSMSLTTKDEELPLRLKKRGGGEESPLLSSGGIPLPNLWKPQCLALQLLYLLYPQSVKCNLNNMTPKELIAHHEEEWEVGGFFIVNGVERCIRIVQGLRAGHVRFAFSSLFCLFVVVVCIWVYSNIHGL